MVNYVPPRSHNRIVVTGASSGIGAATVRLLSASGFGVVALARREDRLRDLAKETGCEYYVCDVTDRQRMEEVAAHIAQTAPISGVVVNAGGAHGADSVAQGKVEDWQWMYDVNVVGAVNTVQVFLPQLRRGGDLLFVTSTAAHETYPGGAGYTAAKHGEAMVAQTLRLELVGEPIRILEVCPGMVKTEEFSLNRLGSHEAAEQVYAGVDEPLTDTDIADVIVYMLSCPVHVNLDRVVVRPVAQASSTVVARKQK